MAAEAAISSLVQLLGDLLIQKLKSLRGVEGKVASLKDELNRMHSFLQDANKKQVEDARVRNWISEIREAAQDAEDTIETFLLNVESRKNRARCTSFSKRMYYLDIIEDEIDSITARLDAIDASRERYGIKDLEEAAAAESGRRLQVESRRRLPHWQKDEHLVGIEDDVVKVLREAILDEEKRWLSVVVIQGMGGIGKSTLSREIYNHSDVVGGRFDCRGWVVVSSEFTPQETIKQLIFQLCEQDRGKMIEEMKTLEELINDKIALQEELKQMLYNQLDSKSYFIVLDDVWETDHLESLITAFPNQQGKKSRLLVTTRNKIITNHDHYVHKMKLLDPDKGWELLLKKAFIGSTIHKCQEELEPASSSRQILGKFKALPFLKKNKNPVIGSTVHKCPEELEPASSSRQILGKFKGLPFLKKNKKPMIGSTIHKCPEELESVGKQILQKCHGLPLAINVIGGLLMETQTKNGWEQVLNQINTYLGKSESNVSSILELSYHNLPPQLKSCFLCLAFFKEDFTIPVKRLVNIWDAQGLIRLEENIKSDEIARSYLNELVDRSMVQIHDLTFDGLVKHCRLHDLVREVCFRKAKEEIGLQIVKADEGSSSESSLHKPRHRVVYVENLDTFSSNQNKHIRYLSLVNVQGDRDICKAIPYDYWKSYRLLRTLELDGFGFRRLPNSFRSLIGLKCLRIHKSPIIYDFTVELPRWLDRLRSLEVLDLGQATVKFPRLVSLKMDKLRCLSASAIVRGLTSVNMWRSIECLKHIRHKDWMRCAAALANGGPLRELGIRCVGRMESLEMMKMRASLEKLKNLVILHLEGCEGADQIGLAMPQLENVTKLTIRGKMRKCPAASTFPPNLSHLTLSETRLRDDPMTELGKLPNLCFLKIQYDCYRGETMQVSYNGFPSLGVLALRYLSLRCVYVDEGGMPQLKHVRVRRCPHLQTRNMRENISISVQ